MGIASTRSAGFTETPIGIVAPFAGATAPANWLLCYGQAVSRVTYSGLFLTISTTYGVGDGSTTFNLPDLRGRAIAGVDNMGGSAASRLTTAVSGVDGATLGTAGGSQIMHTHSHANSASFSGSFSGTGSTTGNDSPDHSHSGTTSMNAYTDFLRLVSAVGTSMENNHHVGRGGGSYSDYSGSFPNHQHDFSTGGASARHAHSFTPAGSVSGTVTMTNANFPATAGGSSQNVQPTIILNYIIRAV
jgi:hypothetical protein